MARRNDGLLRAGRSAAPKNRAQPSHEFAHPERLRQGIIGSRAKRRDLVAFGVPAGYDDDRDIAPTSQTRDDVETVHVDN
jgi:hypothetical protein